MTKFLDIDGLQYLVERIKELVDQATQINIVTTINDQSNNQEIPGAKAVFDLVTGLIADTQHMQIEVVTTLPIAGQSNTIYLLEKVGAKQETYAMHLFSAGKWFNLGDMEINLSDYWAKDDLEAMTNTEIQDIIDDVMGV